MAKKSWFSLLKSFFISERVSKPEKEKRRRWAFGRLKIKRLASVSAPSVCEAEHEQSKHAVTVAIATAAAEAAVAAAQVAAAEVVRLTRIPQSEEETHELSAIKIQLNAPQSPHQYEKEIRDLSATKIQTVFRGYLARKALRALRGLVRLQAIIRGRAVRRQAISTLKCLQSVMNIQSQVCARRIQMVEGTWNLHENRELEDFKDKVIKRRWDDSILSRDEANALFLSKREAVIKRERINEYLLSHRRSAESEQSKVNGRRRYWLEQWVDTQLSKNSDTIFLSNARIREECAGQLKLRNSLKQCNIEALDSPISVSGRSFHHKKQKSVGDDDNGFVPTYMAATESAKAKARSMSSPRLRAVSLDAYSETNSPYKHKLSPISSINSEVTSSSRICNFGGFQQRSSPCLKGLPGPVRSNTSLKDLSFDSECSLPNWDRNMGAFR